MAVNVKNYGPAVSGYLDPNGRDWETVVFQAGKPVLDKELNLQQDIDGGQAESDLIRAMPSGWIANGFLNNSTPVPFFTYNPNSLTLQLHHLLHLTHQKPSGSQYSQQQSSVSIH